ncbi:MAG TPA: hypothetical protein VLA61_06160 [Ideonella sp.]|uniref:hypothetical protein n=1 Tax=Ideonella sp. TaxID=1929293 RepID=UPI002BBEFCFF|nr:hypothetical protein [Ideonella sp.]HSI47832.1 hypothetical protein [Ideonella sp.]
MFKQWVMASALVATAGAAHAFVNATIKFDGYCDGFSDLTTEGSTGAAGTWQNLDCAGSTATGGGAQVRNEAGQVGYTLGTTGVAVLTGGSEFTWVIRGDRTWMVYSTSGQYLNSGTWSPRARPWVAPLSGESRPSWRP